jgi:hypothetical protein
VEGRDATTLDAVEGSLKGSEYEVHLFGDAHEPHLTHFEVERGPRFVTLRWDVKNATAPKWRVLRSDRDFAGKATAGGDQTLVSESAECGAADEQVDDETAYYYTVFAQDQDGAWHRQVKVKARPGDRMRWLHPTRAAEPGRALSTDGGTVGPDFVLRMAATSGMYDHFPRQ